MPLSPPVITQCLSARRLDPTYPSRMISGSGCIRCSSPGCFSWCCRGKPCPFGLLIVVPPRETLFDLIVGSRSAAGVFDEPRRAPAGNLPGQRCGQWLARREEPPRGPGVAGSGRGAEIRDKGQPAAVGGRRRRDGGAAA